MLRDTNTQDCEFGRKKTGCILSNHLSEMYIKKYHCVLNRKKNEYTLHNYIPDMAQLEDNRQKFCESTTITDLRKNSRKRVTRGPKNNY